MANLKIIGNDVLVLSSGEAQYHIVSRWSGENIPLTNTRLIDDSWLYLGSLQNEDEVLIDFVSIRGLSAVVRWRVNSSGEFLSQEYFPAPTFGTFTPLPSYSHVNSPKNLAALARQGSNDMEIYFAIKFLLRDSGAARAFMDSFSPDEVSHAATETSGTTAPQSRLNLTVVFNHNYARNISNLEKRYAGRVSKIFYVLPNIAPRAPRCFSFPAGSYAYHTLIYHVLDRVLQSGDVRPTDWFLFVQDDVYINRHFSHSNLANFFSVDDRTSCVFYRDVTKTRWDYNSSWPWNKRILNRIESQKDSTLGNGFEGFQLFFNKNALVIGVGDVFAIRGEYLSLFAELLGNYISEDIFPEASIPSTLKLMASVTKTRVGTFDGEYIWGASRRKIDKSYIEQFDATRKFFLHPVKAAMAP